MIDLPGVGALGLVSLEWVALGWLSGVRFPEPGASAGTWALRVLVGGCLVAFAQLILSLVGAGLSIPLVLLIAGGAAAALRLGRTRQTDCDIKELAVSRRELVGWALLGLVLLAATARSLVTPEAGWDAYSHWGLRAQAFALAGSVVDAHSEHEYYPPLVPLLEAWLYVHRGLVSIDLGKTVWAVVGSAFAVCLSWHLRLAVNVRWAWLAPYFAVGIVLASTQLLEGFWTGQADLALTAYLSLATLAAWQWLRSSQRVWLVQAAVFAAAAALTKFEGLPRVAIIVVALVIEGLLAREIRVWRLTLLLAVAAGATSLAWTVFEVTHGIAPNGEHLGALQLAGVGLMLFALTEVFGGLRTGGVLLVTALAWLVTGDHLLQTPLRFLALVVIGQTLATLVAFLVGSTAPDIVVVTSATRLVEQFLPIALFVSAVGISRIVHL